MIMDSLDVEQEKLFNIKMISHSLIMRVAPHTVAPEGPNSDYSVMRITYAKK